MAKDYEGAEICRWWVIGALVFWICTVISPGHPWRISIPAIIIISFFHHKEEEKEVAP